MTLTPFLCLFAPFLFILQSRRQRSSPQTPSADPCLLAAPSKPHSTSSQTVWGIFGDPGLPQTFRDLSKVPSHAQLGVEGKRELCKKPQHTRGKEQGEGRMGSVQDFGSVVGSRGGLCSSCCGWESPNSPPAQGCARLPPRSLCGSVPRSKSGNCSSPQACFCSAPTVGMGKALLESATGLGRCPCVPWSCLCFPAEELCLLVGLRGGEGLDDP